MFVLATVAFKISAVPFRNGRLMCMRLTLPVVAFLSVGSKAAGFA